MKADIAIIGAGFAGTAAAYFLARHRSGPRVLLLEKEDLPGVYASGLNAGMIRQQIADSVLAASAREGARWIREERHTLPGAVSFRPLGSLVIGRRGAGSALDAIIETSRSGGLEIRTETAAEWRRQFPALDRADFEAGSFCATDGVVDIHALLHGFLTGFRQLGGTVWTRAAVQEITLAGDRIVSLQTTRGPVEAGVVVNAAGAWASSIGRLAGGEPLQLTPCRRHLFFAESVSFVRPDDPFVWNVDRDFYFRPETGGLLLSACDQEPFPPGPCPTDSRVTTLLAEKLSRYMPRLGGVRIMKIWAALRTLTPDGRFVVRWDSNVKNLFWVAGLGGHGVTCAPSIGQLATLEILG